MQAQETIKCPWCGYPSDKPEDDPDRPEGALDASCCTFCFKWSILEGDQLRKPAMVELLALETEPEARALRTNLKLNRLLNSDSRVDAKALDDISQHCIGKITTAVGDAAQLLSDPRDGIILLMRLTDHLAMQLVCNLAMFSGIDDARGLIDQVCIALRETAGRPAIVKAMAEARKRRAEAMARVKAAKS